MIGLVSQMASIDEITTFWNRQSCGETYAVGESLLEKLQAQEEARYKLEPFIFDFAKFSEAQGSDVLEIGVGMGADHLQWARSHPRSLTGIDLTERSVKFTKARLEAAGLPAKVLIGNAEQLPFLNDSFDIIYSWGVLHHSENPKRAIQEVFRVLRPGGTARVMIYHKQSIVGLLLWLRYGALRDKSIAHVYANYLESPGTQAYSRSEARQLFSPFSKVSLSTKLSSGDLLLGHAGQRHQGRLLRIGRLLWPRLLVRLFPNFGLFLLIEAKK